MAHGFRHQALVFRRLAAGTESAGIVQVLQAVFQVAQENVGRRVPAPRPGQQPRSPRRFSTSSVGRALQGRIAPAADQLEHLGDEFDFADAAGAELDVVRHLPAPHFVADLACRPRRLA